MSRGRVIVLLCLTVCALAGCLPAAASALAPAGGGFFWQSPQPFGGSLWDVKFASADDVWAARQPGGLAYSADAGLTWTPVDLGLDCWVDDLSFPDKMHGRAVVQIEDGGDSRPLLVASDDGGATWAQRPIAAYPHFSPWAADFADADHGWVVGYDENPATGKWYGAVLRTDDAGMNWIESALPSGGAPQSCTAIDAEHLWVTRSRRILTSADGGQTWTVTSLPKGRRIDQLCPIDADRAWALASGGPWRSEVVLKIADGGATWRKVTSLPEYGGASLDAATADTAWLVQSSEGGPTSGSAWVRRTSDGGLTWMTSYLGPDAPTQLAAGPGGLILGTGAGVWRSTDAGATWLQTASTGHSYFLTDVCADGVSGAWAVGQTSSDDEAMWNGSGYGVLLHSAGGGAAWRQQELPLGAPLEAVAFSDAAHGWAVGASGRVLHTGDGGATWTGAPVARTIDLFAVAASGPDCAVAVGYPRPQASLAIVSTADAGATWATTLRPESERLTAVTMLSETHWLVAGSMTMDKVRQALVLETSDGGATWTKRLLGASSGVVDMAFVDATHGWILASDWYSGLPFLDPQPIVVLRTVDGGATWQRAVLGEVSSTGLTSLAFANAEHGWAVGDRVLASDDGGVTWHDCDVGVPGSLSMRAVPMLNGVACGGGAVWAVGRRDIILSTVDTAADSAPPLTIDDGDRQWHRDDVTLHLAPFDAGSGVARTEYRLDGSPSWTIGSEILFGAPLDHQGDGRHTVTYRSLDADGNREAARQCPVLVDTTPPETKARSEASARRGRTGDVSARADDALSPYADITLELGHRVGGESRLVKSVELGWIKIRKWVEVRVRYNVPRGTYWWHAGGIDLAGNAVDWASDAQVKVR